jgi:hypothetical protein
MLIIVSLFIFQQYFICFIDNSLVTKLEIDIDVDNIKKDVKIETAGGNIIDDDDPIKYINALFETIEIYDSDDNDDDVAIVSEYYEDYEYLDQ